MCYRSILAATVIAASLFGADASPCKPATSTAVSVIQSETLSTGASQTTSAVLVETFLTLSTEATSDALTESTSTVEGSSSTILETSLTTLVETTPTADATTSTILIEETPTTLAGSTTTTEAEVCIETQVIVNPGFDDNTNGAPWYHTGHVTQDGAHSSPNSLSITVLKNAGGYGLFQQTLHNLRGNYELSYRWTITEVVPASGNVYCTLQPRIAGHHFASIEIESWGIGDELKLSTDRWSTEDAGLSETLFSIRVDCMGGFSEMSFRFDDVTLTKVCNDHLEPLDTSTTLLETTPTTFAETASTTSVETTLTEATTSTALVEETPTTLAASTTTTEAESCTETQVVINPGFDDNIDGFPWIHDGQVKSDYTPSEPNNLEVTVYYGPTESISQTLHNIKAGEYTFSFHWRIFWENNPSGDYECYIMPRIGTSGLRTVSANEPSDMYAYQTETWYATQDFDEVKLSLEVMCDGDVESIIFNFDDITLTKVCDVDV